MGSVGEMGNVLPGDGKRGKRGELEKRQRVAGGGELLQVDSRR